jgi:hypothetical protein
VDGKVTCPVSAFPILTPTAFQGDEDAIRKAIRDLSFGAAFEPDDINALEQSAAAKVDGSFLLAAQRTLAVEIYETSERAALRKFLYSMDLPDVIALGSSRSSG